MRRVAAWLDHALELGASGIALGSAVRLATHGYDTTDHYRIDPRLGDDADFDHLVAEAARAACASCSTASSTTSAPTSPATGRPSPSGDDAWFRKRGKRFQTFEGHDGLITLEPRQPRRRRLHRRRDVALARRGADGWRLDAAYAVPDQFWAKVLPRVRERFPTRGSSARSFTAITPAIVRAATFDSVTQYELWKAIWSSLNDGNFHELDHALRRHDEFLDAFVPMTFVGNHDVTRIASQARRPRHVEHALVVLLTTGGHAERLRRRRVGVPGREGGALRRGRRRAPRVRLRAQRIGRTSGTTCSGCTST